VKILKAKSGTTVLFRPMKSGLVDMRYFIRCGAIDETRPEDEGLCHALEHMLFAGTETRDWSEVNSTWDRLGADYNAYTWHDRTYYITTCLKQYWQEAYEGLADMIYNPIFPADRWEEIEKGAIISEIQQSEDDPEEFLEEALYEHALGSKYHSVIGNAKNINQATMADLKRFYDQYYCGRNMVFAIAGDLTETQVLRAVNKYDRCRSQRPPKRKKFTFKFDYRPIRKIRKELQQTKLELLKPIKMPRTQRGRVALELAEDCLSQYLFEELREKQGLCYGASADCYDGIPDYMFLQVTTATDKVRFKKMKKTLAEALDNFRTEGLTSERIRNNKRAAIHSTTENREQVDSATDWMWSAWEDGVKEDPFELELKILETISDSTVRRAADAAFTGKMKFGKLSEK